MKKCLFAVLFALLLCAALPAAAVAEDSARLVLTVRVLAAAPADAPQETFTVVLGTEDPTAPLPDGAADGEYRLGIDGNSEKELPPLEFTRPGVWEYRLCQLRGEDKNRLYDGTVYALTVYAVYEGGALRAQAVLRREDSGEKAEAVFANGYKISLSDPPEPDGPGGDSIPRTGALWLPVPILLTVGGGLLLFGTGKRKKG